MACVAWAEANNVLVDGSPGGRDGNVRVRPWQCASTLDTEPFVSQLTHSKYNINVTDHRPLLT